MNDKLTREQYLSIIRPDVRYYIHRYIQAYGINPLEEALLTNRFIGYWDNKFDVVIVSKDDSVISIS
tara:strand:- start:3671 stop:3871 length:201 start_codon:yes stop_codon:yes gene_type:complete